MTASYRYVFYDLRTNKAYAELPMHDARFEWILNKAGGWSGTVPLMDRRVRAQDWRSALMATKMYIAVERDHQLIFGGILWDTNFTDEHDEMAIQGEDIWSYFHHRWLHTDLDFVQWEQLAIVEYLIWVVQASFPGGDIGVVMAPFTPTGVLRDRETYTAAQGHMIGDLVENLSAVINGFDFRFWLQQSPTTGAMQKLILTGYPYLGEPATQTLFHLDYGPNGQVRNFAWQIQGSGSASRAVAISDQGLVATSTANDKIAEGYPLLDLVNTYSNITTQQVLQAHADQDLAALRVPVTIPPLQMAASVCFDQQIWPGDWVRVLIDHPIYFPNRLDSMDGLDHRLVAPYRVGDMKLDADLDVMEVTLVATTLATLRGQLAESVSLPMLSDVQPEVTVVPAGPSSGS